MSTNIFEMVVNILKRLYLKNLFALYTVIIFTLAFSCVCVCLEENPNIINDYDGMYFGGGFAATAQIHNIGYTSQIYDATNGLLTSDANCVLGASDGYIWIGGYNGIIRYDGMTFTVMDPSSGLSNGRCLFEDSRHRIWVGTNDNGVVVIDGNNQTHFTYKENLPSSSIRDFVEDKDGNIFIGTTTGVCYIDKNMGVNLLDDERIQGERILNFDSDSEDIIYGQTKSGRVFSIKNKLVTAVYDSADLGMEKITSILADPLQENMVYICTNTDVIYYGHFGDKAENMERISVAPLAGIQYISYDCGRVWVTSIARTGYLDEERKFHLLEDLLLNSGIEMMTSDYQGNMWFTSSKQGLMKVVSSSFVDTSYKAQLPDAVVNATCIYNDILYIGSDSGLFAVNKQGSAVEDEITNEKSTMLLTGIGTNSKKLQFWRRRCLQVQCLLQMSVKIHLLKQRP